jgi:hypothetical protein
LSWWAQNREFIATLELHPRERRRCIERNVQIRYTCLYPMLMVLLLMMTMMMKATMTN